MTELEIEVTYKYKVTINEDNPIVKEYSNKSELISDLVHYRFMILPVIKSNGVIVNDVEVIEYNQV